MIVGKKYDITLNPTTLRGWTVVRETEKCYVIEKNSYWDCAKGKTYHGTHLPKKSILGTVELEEKENE